MSEESFFKSAAEILNSMNFNFNEEYQLKKEKFFAEWKTIAGEKLAEFSVPTELTDDGILFVKCKNSVAANALFQNKNVINEKLSEKAKSLGLYNFQYIKIFY